MSNTYTFPVLVGGGRSFGSCLDNAYALALNESVTPYSCRNTCDNSTRFYINKYCTLNTASSLLPDRTLFFPSGLDSGDSGNPIFALYEDELLLLSMLYAGGGFPYGPTFGHTEFLDEVQSVINSQLGNDGTIQRVNLWSNV